MIENNKKEKIKLWIYILSLIDTIQLISKYGIDETERITWKELYKLRMKKRELDAEQKLKKN